MAGVDLARQSMQLNDIKAVLSQAKLQIPSPNKKCKQKGARFPRSSWESEPLQLQKSGQRICEWLCRNAQLILLTDDQPWNRNNRCSQVVVNSIM